MRARTTRGCVICYKTAMRFSWPTLLLLGIALFAALPAHAADDKSIEPTNALEEHLQAVQAGERDLRGFIEELVASRVVVLSKREVLKMNNPGEIPALVVPSEDGDSQRLAVFTSPELAQRVARTYPEYRFGIRTDFMWVLAHAAPGLGVAINPGWTLGMTIPSYGVLQMRDQYQDRIDKRLEQAS